MAATPAPTRARTICKTAFFQPYMLAVPKAAPRAAPMRAPTTDSVGAIHRALADCRPRITPAIPPMTTPITTAAIQFVMGTPLEAGADRYRDSPPTNRRCCQDQPGRRRPQLPRQRMAFNWDDQ